MPMTPMEHIISKRAMLREHYPHETDIIPKAVCADGFTVSIQASRCHYCTPRLSGLQHYSSLELGYPSEDDELLRPYAEDPSNELNAVYLFVPIEVVNELIEKHGGIVA